MCGRSGGGARAACGLSRVGPCALVRVGARYCSTPVHEHTPPVPNSKRPSPDLGPHQSAADPPVLAQLSWLQAPNRQPPNFHIFLKPGRPITCRGGEREDHAAIVVGSHGALAVSGRRCHRLPVALVHVLGVGAGERPGHFSGTAGELLPRSSVGCRPRGSRMTDGGPPSTEIGAMQGR